AAGTRFTSGGTVSTITAWDVATGQEALTLHGPAGRFLSAAYSPDGRRLASVGTDETITVWDVATGQEALTLRGRSEQVGLVAFSPDGRRLASIGKDGMVEVWDASPESDESTARRGELADRRWAVWQRWEAEDCLNRELWFSAAWHLAELVKRHPEN